MADDNARWTAPYPRRKPRRGWWDGLNRQAAKDGTKGEQQIIDSTGAAVLEETDPDVPVTTDSEEIA